MTNPFQHAVLHMNEQFLNFNFSQLVIDIVFGYTFGPCSSCKSKMPTKEQLVCQVTMFVSDKRCCDFTISPSLCGDPFFSLYYINDHEEIPKVKMSIAKRFLSNFISTRKRHTITQLQAAEISRLLINPSKLRAWANLE